MAGLPTAGRAEQARLMAEVEVFLERHVRRHAAWEEHVLYPAVERYASPRSVRVTATMRYAHRVVERWIDELAREHARPEPDVRAFARRADQLLGLLAAHFEEEEEVLLPVLDRRMTPEAFEREVVGRGAHGLEEAHP